MAKMPKIKILKPSILMLLSLLIGNFSGHLFFDVSWHLSIALFCTETTGAFLAIWMVYGVNSQESK